MHGQPHIRFTTAIVTACFLQYTWRIQLPYERCVNSDATVPNSTKIYKYLEVLKQQISILGSTRTRWKHVLTASISDTFRDRGSTEVKVLCYKSEGSRFDSRSCHWNFALTKSFRSHYGPEVDSARKEHQEYFLGVKSGRCVRLTTLPPSWATVT